MKLMTEIRDGQCVSSQGWPMNKESEVTHDAAAAHALWLAIVGSVDSNSSLARADALLIAADKIMAEWGFDRERVES